MCLLYKSHIKRYILSTGLPQCCLKTAMPNSLNIFCGLQLKSTFFMFLKYQYSRFCDTNRFVFVFATVMDVKLTGYCESNTSCSNYIIVVMSTIIPMIQTSCRPSKHLIIRVPWAWKYTNLAMSSISTLHINDNDFVPSEASINCQRCIWICTQMNDNR